MCLEVTLAHLLHEDGVLPGALVHFQLQNRDVTEGAAGGQEGHLSPGVRPAGLMRYHWALPQSLAVLMSPCVLPPRFLA